MITKYTEYCVLCGYPNVEEHHLICGQLLFEKEDILRGESEESAREHFRQIFGRSYL